MRHVGLARRGACRTLGAVAAIACALLLPAGAAAAAPANDDFANAVTLAGDAATTIGSVTDATSEASEPAHAGQPAAQSVWYRWTAAEGGITTFDTCVADFDSRLAVYTGGALAGLTVVQSNDDSESCGAGAVQSEVEFDAAAGTTYAIAVDGFGGAGTFTLAWQRQVPRPTNTSPPLVTGGTTDGETLAVTPGQWSAEGTLAYGYQWQRCNSTPKNVAIGRPASASHTFAPGNAPEKAVDGLTSTYWNSGDFEPQWLAIDLQAPYPLSKIRAAIAQLPDGYTIHDVSVAGPNPDDDLVPLVRFAGVTTDRDAPLEAAGPANQVEYIRIDTTMSPSWVAWQEIEALSRCSDIAGATGATYALSGSDAGSTVRAIVRASNAAGATAAASGETGLVAGFAPTNITAPSIAGRPTVSASLTATPGSWRGSQPLSYSYSWQRCKGTTCSNIIASNDATYDVAPDDEGFRLRVVVTASNLAGSAAAVTPTTSVVPYVCEVPPLRGKTVPAARRSLVAEHCSLGKVKRAYSKKVRRGRVVSQSPAPYQSLRGGAKVSVVVSRGRSPKRRHSR